MKITAPERWVFNSTEMSCRSVGTSQQKLVVRDSLRVIFPWVDHSLGFFRLGWFRQSQNNGRHPSAKVAKRMYE